MVFIIATGDIEEYPGLDSIHSFKVTVENGNVKVRAKITDLLQHKRMKPMTRALSSATVLFAIVGGGPSGAVCAETLRQEGFNGRVMLICRENYLPYDRVKLSKQLNYDVEKTQLRSAAFYDEYDIEVKLGIPAVGLNGVEKKIRLANGETVIYNKLYIATGVRPAKLEIEGKDLENVLVLRDTEHAKKMLQLLQSTNEIVIVGGGFISIELAAYATGKVKKVTVVMRNIVPFIKTFGKEVGERIKSFCEEQGVLFLPKCAVTKCIGENGILHQVEINDEFTLKADVLVMAVGTFPNTDFLHNSGVILNSDGTIIVDRFMKTNMDDVYAGGDIAYAPVYCNFNQSASVGHYPLAHYHGKIAALNMLHKDVPCRSVPFFWTMIFGKSFRYTGYGKFTNLQIIGSLEELTFVVYYFDEQDRVTSILAANKDPIVSLYAEWLSNGKHLYKSDLSIDPIAWTRLKID